MSSSNCCFLTFIQISQEAGQVVWYSHLLKNFPQFIVIHTVKGFGIVNKAKVDVFFLEPSCCFDDTTDVVNLISVFSAFSKSCLNIWRFMVHILLKPGLKNFEHYFTRMWDECKHVVVWAFFGTGMKTDLFQSCGHCWVFQICWHIECSTFTASCFCILNQIRSVTQSCPTLCDPMNCSTPGLPVHPLPPLALFMVMLPKTHSTLHSMMSGSRWLIISSWLSG